MEDSGGIANMRPDNISFKETFCFDQSLYHRKKNGVIFSGKKSKLKLSSTYDLYNILGIRENIMSNSSQSSLSSNLNVYIKK